MAVLIAYLLSSVIACAAWAQEARSLVLLTGVVQDTSGAAVAGARIRLRSSIATDQNITSSQGTELQEVTSDAAGRFELRVERQARYGLQAETADHRRGELVTDSGTGPDTHSGSATGVNDDKDLHIVVRPAPGTLAMDFADKPEFTVAGITDWTAVGGHGSDATLRTSEDLARETAAPGKIGSSSASGINPKREATLREAAATHPDSYETQQALGVFLLSGGAFQQASGPLERASALHGHLAEDEYQAALACAGEGDPARARQHLSATLRQRDRAEDHALAGVLEERLGDPVAAVREDARAAALDPSEGHLLAWASELLLHRAILQAAEVFARGVAQFPESVRLRSGFGAALFAEAKYAEAAAELCHASDLDPTNRAAYVELGKLGLGSPEPERCVNERLLRWVTSTPDDAEANSYAGRSLLRTDRARAVPLLRHAVALNPELAEAWLDLGVAALAERQAAAAEQDLRAALAADPRLAEAHYRLGVLLRQAGDQEGAERELTLHEQLKREDAERVEQERRAVKEFVIAGGK